MIKEVNFMKIKSALFLGCMALSLSALLGCNQSPSTGGGGQNEDKYSQVLKDCASQIMQVSNAHSSTLKRGFVPYTDAPAQATAMPGVYLYWSGLLNEIDGVSIVDQAIKFSGTYKFNGSGGYVQDITFDLSVHFDEENNKFAFLGKQDIPTPDQYSYLILECDYNFTSKELGGFTILMQPAGFNSGSYMRYSSNGLEVYNYGSGDSHETDQDYITYSAIARSGMSRLESQIDNEMVLEGDKLQSARQAFVSASDYCDEVCDGVNFDVEIVTA